jgi:hypothetical protein
MRCVERDAFTVANGYDGSLEIDGVALRDRVWLELTLDRRHGTESTARSVRSGGSADVTGPPPRD